MGYNNRSWNWYLTLGEKKDDFTVVHLGTFAIHAGSGTIIANDEIYIGGQKIPDPPCELNNTTIINNKVYVNGYEYKRGKWKKTLAAWWHKYF
jgi:hypothetical protein